MSVSNEWAEWHLTPRGWERGSYKEDFKSEIQVNKPDDAVCTYLYREYMSSPFSSVSKEHRCEWSSINEEEIKELKEQFGEAPKRL